MLDEPGSIMEPEDAYGDAGIMVAFGMSGPLVVEEFDGEEEGAGREYGEGSRLSRLWRRVWRGR